MFLPTTPQEVRGGPLDVILVSGDTYIDSPFSGVAVIGKVLQRAGYRVGVIAQPDPHSPADITRLGEPRLFWGVSGGCVDSMLANYTATRKKRHQDDFTPGGENTRRPDRAVIVYANLIRRYWNTPAPIVLGGIEASLRRVAHYDYWDDRIRRSILADAKADVLVYGMGERTVVELAAALRAGRSLEGVRGVCYLAATPPTGYLELPAFETVAQDKRAFIEMFHTFYRHQDALTGKGLYQRQDTRYLIHNPPALPLTQAELDAVYALDFARDVHPYYRQQGEVRAVETIATAVVTHRGCYGECNFCAIAVHEGRTVQWRSADAIVAEVEQLARRPGFKGYIHDLSAPTANMYGFECRKKLEHGACAQRRCLYPAVCARLPVDHGPQLALMRRLRRIPGVKKVFVASGVRYDLVLADGAHGERYLRELVAEHLSGQMKIAPEHTEDRVLARMGKPQSAALLRFKALFERLNRETGKPQFLTYYLIAAHPGCTERDMERLKAFAGRELRLNPEQVQVFTPTPSTYSSLMYYTEMDPFTGEKLFVEKDLGRKQRQKEIVVRKAGAKSSVDAPPRSHGRREKAR